jgi:hypothetical protein
MKEKQSSVGVHRAAPAPKEYALSPQMRLAAMRAKFQVPLVSIAPKYGFKRDD